MNNRWKIFCKKKFKVNKTKKKKIPEHTSNSIKAWNRSYNIRNYVVKCPKMLYKTQKRQNKNSNFVLGNVSEPHFVLEKLRFECLEKKKKNCEILQSLTQFIYSQYVYSLLQYLSQSFIPVLPNFRFITTRRFQSKTQKKKKKKRISFVLLF